VRALDRREFLWLLAGASGAAALAGCGGTSPGPAASGPAASGPPKVSASTKAAVSHLKSLISTMPWAVARDKDLFKDVGISQEVTEFNGGGDTVRGLLQGGNDYGLTTPSATATAFVSGQPVRIIGGGFGATSIVVVAKQDSPIRTVKDLAGKKVGYSEPGSASQFVILRTLRDNNVQANPVSTGGVPESLTALRNGVVDAVWTPYPQPQRFSREFQIVFSAAKTVPNFVEFVLTTTADYARQHADVLRAFLYAYDRALEFIQKNPDESATIWAKFASIDPQPVIAAMKEIPGEAWSIRIKLEALKLVEESMLEFKQVDRPIDWKKFVIQDFLPADKRTTLP